MFSVSKVTVNIILIVSNIHNVLVLGGDHPVINGFKTFKCPNPEFEQVLAIPTRNNEECFVNIDCKGAGFTAKKIHGYAPHCVYNSTTHTSLCCYQTIRHFCEYGRPRLPLMKCDNLLECNRRLETHKIGWCDDKWNVCCESDSDTNPFCINSMYLRVAAPKCDEKCKGYCDKGRCCPPFSGTRNHIILPEYPYNTNIPCDPKYPLLNNFQFGFCPTGNNTTIWIMGKKTLNGTKTVFVNLHCQSTSDCGQDGNGNWFVCVKQMSDYGKCYQNPLVKFIKVEISRFWYRALMLSTIIGTISAIVGLVADCLYQNGAFGKGLLTSSGAELEPMIIAKDQ